MKRKIAIILTTVFTLSLLVATPAFAHDGVGGDEYAAADIMLVMALGFFALAGVGIIFSITNGELRNPETIKYQMLQTASFDEDGTDVEDYILIEDA